MRFDSKDPSGKEVHISISARFLWVALFFVTLMAVYFTGGLPSEAVSNFFKLLALK